MCEYRFQHKLNNSLQVLVVGCIQRAYIRIRFGQQSGGLSEDAAIIGVVLKGG